MPPKKTKAEEAMAFLDDLDNLEAPPVTTDTASPRVSVDAPGSSSGAGGADEGPATPGADEEAASALAFLEAQIKHKRAPLSKPTSSAPSAPSRTASPSAGPGAGVGPNANVPTLKVETAPTLKVDTAPPVQSGWGSLWSSATSAIQSATRVADEQYKKVKTEGVAGIRGQLDHLQVGGVDLAKLRKDAEDRVGGIVKHVGNVDLDKLRNDVLTRANSTFTTFINTVAPPISEHETIELWLAHPMTGYDGVEGVVYRAWSEILDQTESGEMVIVWSQPERELPSERSLNPLSGWDEGWKATQDEVTALQAREEKNPRGRAAAPNPHVPVTTVPVFLVLQPLLAPLPIPEPQLLVSATTEAQTAPLHLYFILSLHDPIHGLQFTSVSQPSPGDWLDVEYDRSDWVEERLVDVIKTSVAIVAQDYVSTRMGLKSNSALPVAQAASAEADAEAAAPAPAPAAAGETSKKED